MADDLDNPIWVALTGPHARYAEVRGRAARYQPEFSPFHAVAGPDGWADLARLAEPGGVVAMSGPHLAAPPGWAVTGRWPGVQLTGERVTGEPDPEAVTLTAADAPEMLDLVARTDPGPFRKRAVELGRYLGIRRGGALVAMAGERLRVPGWTEISAVCTDPAHRGQGLAGRLTRAIAYGIRQRGDLPFLATTAANTGALRLYEALGFTRSRDVLFMIYRAPL
ncbi:MAG TPA: GNAT family N-acetyltransferase [Actinoplanes sp.]|nr:GNAT family N-acetyltransferase [Actinoplanes sp.]